MNYLGKAGFFIAAALLLFTACVGEVEVDNIDPTSVHISITKTLNVGVGDTKALQITRQNTDDFTLSVDPASGSGCIKKGNDSVRCTPTRAGDYTVTVTAAADETKKSTAKVTVPELESEETEYIIYADETENAEEITFYAAGYWEATVTDSAGNVPDWIGIDADGFAINNSNAAAIQEIWTNGMAGKNSIRVTLRPNDSGADRTATITITTANSRMVITITQLYVKKDGAPYGTPETVMVSIYPASASVAVGVSRTFTVTGQNTADFTLSVSPASGSGCVKSGNSAVTCTPTAAGTYTVRVTATADSTKSATAVLTVTASAEAAISISPASASVAVGVSGTFTVTGRK